MVTNAWSFAGYAFPWDCVPTRGQSDSWNKKRKVVIHTPLNSDIDVLTNFGFESARRTIRGHCTLAFKNQMMSYFGGLTVGALVDSDGVSQSCQILEASFETLRTGRYAYTIQFIAR
jgi:hypothetical protein